MKTLKYLFLSVLLMGMASSCDSDLDTVTYDSSQVTISNLVANKDASVLSAKEKSTPAVTFAWSVTNFHVDVAVTYALEADYAGKAFASPVVVSSAVDTYKIITTEELNKAVRQLQDKYAADITDTEAAQSLEFRIAASFSTAMETVYSNVVSLAVTPFIDEPAKIYIIGDYCGWSHDNSQYLFSPKFNDEYSGLIFFDGKAANGWKITPLGEWGAEWADGGVIDVDGESTLVTAGGGNITAFTKSWYQFDFNTTTGVLKATNSADSFGLVGQFNGWGGQPDQALTLERDAKGSYMTATLSLVANEGFKLRADSDWAWNIGPDQLGDLTGCTGADGNLVVAADGTYTIKWYFNREPQTFEAIKN